MALAKVLVMPPMTLETPQRTKREVDVRTFSQFDISTLLLRPSLTVASPRVLGSFAKTW